MHSKARLVVAIGFAVALTSSAAMSAAAGPAPTVPPHRHFIQIEDKLVPVGPQVCGAPSMQFAFNQFHANAHVGTPGTFAMDHEHNRTDIVARGC